MVAATQGDGNFLARVREGGLHRGGASRGGRMGSVNPRARRRVWQTHGDAPADWTHGDAPDGAVGQEAPGVLVMVSQAGSLDQA